MPATELFTSIPARVSRPLADGRDVGPAWTRACIASWQQAGYAVVSVNAASEAASVRAQHPGVRVAEVARDGSAQGGRPMVFVADMLALMAASPAPAVAIANADVMCLAEAAAQLRGWQPAGFGYSNRLDIACPAGSAPQLHGGVDFLVVQTRHLQALSAPGFLFGTPWWDYWLPLALMGRGVPGQRLAVNGLPLITHLQHADRWNARDFTGNFALFAHALAAAAEQAPDSDAMLQLGLDTARNTSAQIHRLNGVLDLQTAGWAA